MGNHQIAVVLAPEGPAVAALGLFRRMGTITAPGSSAGHAGKPSPEVAEAVSQTKIAAIWLSRSHAAALPADRVSSWLRPSAPPAATESPGAPPPRSCAMSGSRLKMTGLRHHRLDNSGRPPMGRGCGRSSDRVRAEMRADQGRAPPAKILRLVGPVLRHPCWNVCRGGCVYRVDDAAGALAGARDPRPAPLPLFADPLDGKAFASHKCICPICILGKRSWRITSLRLRCAHPMELLRPMMPGLTHSVRPTPRPTALCLRPRYSPPTPRHGIGRDFPDT